MRNIWVVAIGMVAAGCSGIESKAWDKNHDGLISQCEGLGRGFCELTPGCQAQEVACLAICLDDGSGGCTNPCGDGFQCVPKAPPSCKDLDAQQCASDSRCIADTQVCSLVCVDDGRGGCVPCGGSACRDRDQGPSCALVPINSCASIPSCEVQTVTSCNGGSGGVADAISGSSSGCVAPQDTCTTTQVCVNKTVQSCEETSSSSCTANPACELVDGPVCEIACTAAIGCPPCATAQPRCATRSVTSSCETRNLSQCSGDGLCMVESYACAAVCEDDGKGGCLPCPGAPSRCVPMPQASPVGPPEQK